MIVFACASCQKKLSVKDELAGKRAKCPSCGESTTVPTPSENLVTAAPETAKRSPIPDSKPAVDAEHTLPPKGPTSDVIPARTLPSGEAQSVNDSSGETSSGGSKAN